MRQLVRQHELELRLTAPDRPAAKHRRTKTPNVSGGALSVTQIFRVHRSGSGSAYVDRRLRQHAPGAEPARHTYVTDPKIYGKQRRAPETRPSSRQSVPQRRQAQSAMRTAAEKAKAMPQWARSAPPPCRAADSGRSAASGSRRRQNRTAATHQSAEEASGQMVFQRQPAAQGSKETSALPPRTAACTPFHSSCASTSARAAPARPSTANGPARSARTAAPPNRRRPCPPSESASSFACALVMAAWTKFGSAARSRPCRCTSL